MNEAFANTNSKRPVVFLSHASEDKELSRKLARQLFENGIEVFYDEWEIRSGDSIREKLDHGLGHCTHFVALLTPISVQKPWVRAEMDAAFVRRISGQCAFIPLRHDLRAEELPPLLRGILSPELSDLDSGVKKLVEDILEESRKPDLGAPSATFQHLGTSMGLSSAAARIVKVIIERSKNGVSFDPKLRPRDLSDNLDLSPEAIRDGIEELLEQGLVRDSQEIAKRPLGFKLLMPEDHLFALFDEYFKPWSPRDDALTIAADLVNDNKLDEDVSPDELAKKYKWDPRRINPAISYLAHYDAIRVLRAIGTAPYSCARIWATSKTRHFLRESEQRFAARDLLHAKRDQILEIANRHKAFNVRLFGSSLLGRNTPESDIDLLVSLKPHASLIDLEKMKAELEDLLRRPVDVVDETSLHQTIRDNILIEAEAI